MKPYIEVRINNNEFCRLYIWKMVMRIAILRKCITTIDIILVMRNQRDQHVEEQKDIETKMRQNEHCMLSCKHLVIEFYFQDSFLKTFK